MKRIVRLTESDLSRIIRRVISEQKFINERGAKEVAGPFKDNKNKLEYYVYEDDGVFFIFYKTATEKEPTLKSGSLWDNSGKGYNTKEDAIKKINTVINDGKDMSRLEESFIRRRFR